jgi:hypothetical protein
MDQDERKIVDEMDEEATFGAGLFLEGEKFEKFEKAKAEEGSCFDEFEYRERDYYTKADESESE